MPAPSLADLGADVIKVEPKEGDPARGFMRLIGATVGLKGNNYYFESNNRNKRSIAMDLKSAGGKEVFLKLIDTGRCFPYQHEHRCTHQDRDRA